MYTIALNEQLKPVVYAIPYSTNKCFQVLQTN